MLSALSFQPSVGETVRMRAPQAPRVRGPASKIFRTRRDQLQRASLEKSALSRASGAGSAALGLSAGADDSALVGVGAVEWLAVASGILDPLSRALPFLAAALTDVLHRIEGAHMPSDGIRVAAEYVSAEGAQLTIRHRWFQWLE